MATDLSNRRLLTYNDQKVKDGRQEVGADSSIYSAYDSASAFLYNTAVPV